MTRIARYFLRPTYSHAEMLGLAVIWNAFDLSQWMIAIPLIAVWIFGCAALAEKAGAA